MKSKIKITINLLLYLFILYQLFNFQSDLHLILFWTLIIIQIALIIIIFIKARKYLSSIIKLNLIPLLIIIIVYSIHHNNEQHFEKSMKHYLNDNKTTKVKISDTTRFKWDKMYTIMPYTSNEDINRTIGQKWAGVYFRSAPLTEGQTLVLFMFDGKVNHYIYLDVYHLEECNQGCNNNVEVSL